MELAGEEVGETGVGTLGLREQLGCEAGSRKIAAAIYA